MKVLSRFALVVVGLASLPAIALCHYNMLLPQPASVKAGELVTLLYQWGHPFEHQLFDAPSPESVVVFSADGTKTDVSKSAAPFKTPGADGKEVRAFRFTFTPARRGDYLAILIAPAIWMPDEQEFFQDTVKVVLHAQAQQGWDRAAGVGFELVPLTRPYGLKGGTVFQCQALFKGKPVPGALVEVERYNPQPPKALPPDEQITAAVKTDPNGVLTCTLSEAGWWCVTCQRDGGKRTREEKECPVRERTTLWVHVDAKGP